MHHKNDIKLKSKWYVARAWYHHNHDLDSVGGGESTYKGFIGTFAPWLRRQGFLLDLLGA